MNRIERFIDTQMREIDGNIMVLAYCFLLLGGFAIVSFPASMTVWDRWLMDYYHITTIMETTPMMWMVEPYGWLSSLYIALVVWEILNIIQAICIGIDNIQDWFYFRKWGEHGR